MKRNAFTLADKLQIACQLCECVTNLHQKSIFDLNLKPSRILFDSQKRPFLSGWELLGRRESYSQLSEENLSEDETSNESQNNIFYGYSAPELVNRAMNPQASSQSPQSDIFSLGMILHYLFFRIDAGEQSFYRDKRLYDGFNLVITEYAVGSNFFLDKIKDLIQNMAKQSPSQRPPIAHASDILQKLSTQLQTQIKSSINPNNQSQNNHSNQNSLSPYNSRNYHNTINYPLNQSYVNPNLNASYINPVRSASYINPALNASYINPTLNPTFINPALNASYVNPALNASIVNPTLNASYISPALNASYIGPALNASYINPSLNASYINPALNASYISPALNTSYISPALNASYINPNLNGINSMYNGNISSRSVSPNTQRFLQQQQLYQSTPNQYLQQRNQATAMLDQLSFQMTQQALLSNQTNVSNGYNSIIKTPLSSRNNPSVYQY